MLDPFSFYSRMVSAALDMAGTATRATETLTASGDVIAHRTALIGDAVRSPLTGDYAELGLMVPEKVEAFTRSGVAIADDLWAMQSAFVTQAQQVGSMALRGRPPTLGELSALAEGNLRSFERAGRIGASGLKPIHASATANARRLKRRRK